MQKTGFRLVTVVAVLLIATFALAMPGVHCQEQKPTFRMAFQLEGAIEKPGDWTVERLSTVFAMDVKQISYTLKKQNVEQKGTARCVPLLALVQSAKPRLNPKVKNHSLAFVVIVRAEDGYTVAFSLGELLPSNGKREAWLALDQDGRPLPKQEGPVELIVPEDAKPSRWVHGITRITVIDTFQAEQPDANKAK